METTWYKCKGGVWCELNKIDTTHPYLEELEGVYIIWCGGTEKSILRVGQGFIKSELETNKKDIAILAFRHLGVFVTWAEVPKAKRKNVVSYLAKTLKPKMSSSYLIEPPLEINLPW